MRRFGLSSGFLVFAVSLAGCGKGGSGTPRGGDDDVPVTVAPSFAAAIIVTDETGRGLSGASVTDVTGSGASVVARAAAADGRVDLPRLDSPRLFLVEATGRISETVAVGRGDRDSLIEVRLLDERGPSGERRLSLHFAGDVMLGRRYLEPTLEETPLVTPGDGGVSARAVVAPIAPLFTAADIRSLNLETVVGTHAVEDAYPKKRFLLQSPPETMDALALLEPDIVTLGNNHTRDWLEPGLATTVDALDAAGFRRVGAGTTEAAARAPLIFDRAGYRLGCLSYTSVNGDFVNDNLPDATREVPFDLKDSEAWQYEARLFGFTGVSVSIPEAARRIGAVWEIFEDEQRTISSDAELAQLWTAIVAVYPEMQDWVARRGHGGANPYTSNALVSDIALLQASGAELIIVQLHSGFQFTGVKSSLVESAAHRAIDSGAHLVICHHPHVLQGLEWYQGRLIAYSLGNFVFDQDFLATFNSCVLRVVLQETDVLEARLLPVVLDLYRPTPVVGRAARNIVQMVHERSIESARSERVQGTVRKMLRPRPAGAEVPSFTFERNTARIERRPQAIGPVTVRVEYDVPTWLESPGLTRTRAADSSSLAGLEFGRDLFRWGSFEDEMADSRRRGGIHWKVDESIKRIEVIDDAVDGVRALRLRRKASNASRVLVRPFARTTFSVHDVYEDDLGGGAVAADGLPSYTLTGRGKRDGDGAALVRFDVYDFDDSNPTADPESQLLRSRVLPLPIPIDGQWHDFVLDIPEGIFAGAGTLEPNATMIYMALDPPASGTSLLWIDDLRFIQWRGAAELPDGFAGYDAVRLDTDRPAETWTLERTE